MFLRLVACLLLALGFGSGCCHDPFIAGGRLYDDGPIGGYVSGGCVTGGCGTASCGVKKPFGCQDGCAEWYLDEWLSDPPKGCDPCDDCGNYVGYRGGHHLGGLLHKLWGYRYVPSGVSSYSDYHGYAHATRGPAFEEAFTGDLVGGSDDGFSPSVIESQPHSEIVGSGRIDSSYYDIEPGETLVPGSVRVTEGGAIGEGAGIGEPTPAPLPTPTPAEAGAMPNILPGPAASKRKAPATRPAVHRQTRYTRSPRSRPLPE